MNEKSDDRKSAGRSGKGEGEEGGERIAKRLARAGVASRRDAEQMIAEGRVSVNGRKLESPAINVGPRDRIEVDGAALPAVERTRLFLFHKPAGLVTTNRDPQGRSTVFDALPQGLPRLITVGRLDLNTEGLLLLTNDGGLARVLELPSTGWLRRYRVRVHGKVEPEALEKLKEGTAVDGVFYGAIEATLDRVQGSNAWLTIGLREGKNREVRNVLGALGLDVTRLIRISYGPFQLGDLAEGAVQEIRGRMLRDQLGERLIRDAGADFDAPVTKPFARDEKRREAHAGDREDRPRPDRREPVERPGKRERAAAREAAETSRRPARADRPDRQERRDNALGRLDTRPTRGGQGGGKGGDKREERRGYEVPARRTTNVWMAPGARPVGKKKAEAEADVEEKPRRKPARPSPRGEGRPKATGEARPRRQDAPRHERRDEGEGRKRRFENSAAPRRERREDGDRRERAPGRTRAEGRPGEKRFGKPRAASASAAPRPRQEGRDGPRSPRPAGSGEGRPRTGRDQAGGASGRLSKGPRKGPAKGPSSGPRKGPPKGPPKGRKS